MVFADYDVGKVKLKLVAGNMFSRKEATIRLLKQATNRDGLIQNAFVPLLGDNMPDWMTSGANPIWSDDSIGFFDVFQRETDGRWHGHLEAYFLDNQDASGDYEPYTAFDYVELSTNLHSIGMIWVDDNGIPGRTCNYTHIQTAIDAADPFGTTILVAPGAYVENLDMRGKDLVLRSVDPFDAGCVANTVIDGGGEGEGPVIAFQGSESDLCVVSGFTIQNGNGYFGGGVAAYGASASIENCVIAGNQARWGGGLALCRGVVRGCTVMDNTAYLDAELDGTGYPEATGLGGALYNCKVVLENRIYGNVAQWTGAGIHESGILGDARIVNNVVYDNLLLDSAAGDTAGGGIHIAAKADAVQVLHNTVLENWLAGEGEGESYAASLVIEMPEVEGEGEGEGEALPTQNPPQVEIANCILRKSVSGADSSEWDRITGYPDVSFCNIESNEGESEKTNWMSNNWNFGGDAGFADTTNGLWELALTSPCINAARVAYAEVKRDLAGNVRGGAPDIGAVEFTQGGVPGNFVNITGPAWVEEGASITLTAVLNGDFEGETVTYQWWHGEDELEGETSATLDLDAVDASDAGEYVVEVTFGSTTVSSPGFWLYVAAPAQAEGETETPGGPVLEVDPPHLFFGYVPVMLGWAAVKSFTVHNAGGGTLSGDAYLVEDAAGCFSLHFGQTVHYEVKAGESREVVVYCAPLYDGNFSGSVAFSGGNGAIATMSATGYDPDEGESAYQPDTPDSRIAVWPSILQFGCVAPNSTKDLTLTVANTGTDTLHGFASALSPYSSLEGEYLLDEGESTEVTIRFTSPTTQGDYNSHVAFSGGFGQVISVYATNISGSTTIIDGVRINEIVSWNTTGIQDEDGDYVDWVELYNENSTPVSMCDWKVRYVPDTGSPQETTLPSAVTIPANDYAILYASGKSNGGFHLNYTLDQIQAAHLQLYAPSAALLSDVGFAPSPISNVSYSRMPDKGGSKSLSISTEFIWRPESPMRDNYGIAHWKLTWVQSAYLFEMPEPDVHPDVFYPDEPSDWTFIDRVSVAKWAQAANKMYLSDAHSDVYSRKDGTHVYITDDVDAHVQVSLEPNPYSQYRYVFPNATRFDDIGYFARMAGADVFVLGKAEWQESAPGVPPESVCIPGITPLKPYVQVILLFTGSLTGTPRFNDRVFGHEFCHFTGLMGHMRSSDVNILGIALDCDFRVTLTEKEAAYLGGIWQDRSNPPPADPELSLPDGNPVSAEWILSRWNSTAFGL